MVAIGYGPATGPDQYYVLASTPYLERTLRKRLHKDSFDILDKDLKISYSRTITKANLWYMPSRVPAISARIQRARKTRGLTQEVLAERVHVTRGAIGHWEQGVTLPSTAHLSMLAKVLGVPMEWLVKGGANPFQKTQKAGKDGNFTGIEEAKGLYTVNQEIFDKETLLTARKFYRLPKKQRRIIRDLLDQLLPT